MYRIVIQHAADSGLFHPAFYADAPLPGDGDKRLRRYKSKGHHKVGFSTLKSAQDNAAADLAPELGVAAPDGGFPVREMPEAGADVLFEAVWADA